MEYQVIGNITHSGKSYTEGDTLDLPEAAAAPLIAAGVLEDPNAEPEVKEEKRGPKVKKEKKSTTAPEVGGERVETGEPSLDGPESPEKTVAEDVTPVTTDTAPEDQKDPSAGL